ncbi:hypothetical protein A2U01_0007358 [Trifolium medium]|uniref:Uncharacterized protein n=1 Tax=Trifolium medium TaxID=97028 RepID=A0A392MGQ9_9FABA|nr:hypothetical protein [Trifolium medium]
MCSCETEIVGRAAVECGRRTPLLNGTKERTRAMEMSSCETEFVGGRSQYWAGLGLLHM